MSEEYPYIDSIAYWIRWSQELILVLSVPTLTIGLVVGTFDFLSGGTLLHYTAIKYGWTALQALVLDACFAMYWVKAFMAKGWGVRIASGLLGLLLGFVAGGINFLQQVSELLHITALDSLLHLGFPPEFLLLLRALLSVILLAIGACSVARKERVTKPQTKQETPKIDEPQEPEQETQNTDQLQIAEDVLALLKTYPKIYSWLVSSQKTTTLEDVIAVTNHSKKMLTNRLNDGTFKRSPRNQNLILISSVIEWLKVAPLPGQNGHETTPLELVKMELNGKESNP